MKKAILVLFSVLLSSLAWSQSETRSVDRFDMVSVATGIDAKLVKGSDNSVYIESSSVDLDKILTEVKNGELNVYVKKKWYQGWGKSYKINATITYSGELSAISSSSGAEITADHVISSDELDLSSSSGADLELDINVDKLDADVSSGADIDISGQATDAVVEASSGSSFDGKDLKCDKADLDVSSGADIYITVNKELVADASSGGSIKYKGNPSKRDIDKSSGGSVRQK